MNLFRQLACVPDPASSGAAAIDRLHASVLLTTLAGTFVIVVVTLWMLVRFRGPLHGPVTPRVHGPVWVHVVVIVGLLSLFLAWWVRGYDEFLRLETPPPGAMPVYVTAKQWMWEFTYPDGSRAQDQLVVPRGQAVRLALSSRDVIHSFFVPAFRIKQDAVPGRTTLLWFEAVKTGEFPIFCAEYCGLSHSAMRGSVRVLEPEAWARWKQANRGSPQVGEPGALAGLAAEGRTLAAEKGCLACHSVDGTSLTGPTWVGLWYADVPLADGTHVLADEAYLTRSMMQPEVEIVAGYGPVMPSFRGRLDAPETAALLEYIRWLEHP